MYTKHYLSEVNMTMMEKFLNHCVDCQISIIKRYQVFKYEPVCHWGGVNNLETLESDPGPNKSDRELEESFYYLGLKKNLL